MKKMRAHRGKLTLLGLGMLLGTLLLSPAGAHVTSVRHLWLGHFKPLVQSFGDKRYVRYEGKIPDGETVRGIWTASGFAASELEYAETAISFPLPMQSRPTVHLIGLGDLMPNACSGGVTNPRAEPGHLCVFVGYQVNTQNAKGINGSYDQLDPTASNASSRFGTALYVYPAAAGGYEAGGSWAATAPL